MVLGPKSGGMHLPRSVTEGGGELGVLWQIPLCVCVYD